MEVKLHLLETISTAYYPQLQLHTLLYKVQTQLVLVSVLALVILLVLVALERIMSKSLLVLVAVLVFVPFWVVIGLLVLVKEVVTLVLGGSISEMVIFMGFC